MQNLAVMSEVRRLYGVERGDSMIILVLLIVVLILIRKRRTKLKFDIEL
jgi:hypothetical protein